MFHSKTFNNEQNYPISKENLTMKQCIMIDGVEVQYAIETKAILTVLGSVYIYRPVTFIDTLHIVYLGLQRNYGYTFDEFQMAVRKGQIRASKKEDIIRST